MLNKSTSYNYISIYTLYISKKKINATSVETHAMFVCRYFHFTDANGPYFFYYYLYFSTLVNFIEVINTYINMFEL